MNDSVKDRGLNKRLWSLLLFLAVALSFVAVLSNPAFTPVPETNILFPPFEEPEIAEALPGDDLVAELVGVDLVRVRNRPPDNRLYQLNTPLAQDAREALIDQGWERRWRGFDLLTEVVVIVEATRTQSLNPPTIKDSCSPEELFDVAGAEISGVNVSGGGMVSVCAYIERGKVRSAIAVTGPEDTEVRLKSALEGMVAYIEPRLPDLPDDTNQLLFQRQSIHTLRVELLTTAAFVVVVGFSSIVSDRNVWRRLFTRRKTGTLNPLHQDVEQQRRDWYLKDWTILAFRMALFLGALRLAAKPPLSSNYATMATLAVAYILGWVLQYWMARRDGTPRRPLLTGWAVVPALIGLVVTVLLLVTTALLWISGVGFLVLGSGSGGLATWEITGLGTSLVLAALVLLLVSGQPLRIGRRWAMRAMQDRPRGAGRPVLMLRSFGDDQLTLRVRRRDRAGFFDSLVMKRWERFEELTALMLSRFGPPVATGEPGQVLPPGLGAQRFTFSDDEWQPAIKKFADESVLISVFLGKTAALSWELELVANSGYLHKTIFLVPPVNRRERATRLRLFAESYGLPEEIFDTGTASRVPLAICWPLGWGQPLVVSGASADDVSYEFAIERCADALLGDESAATPQHVVPTPIYPQYREVAAMQPAAPRPGWLSNPKTAARAWTVSIGLTLIATTIGPLLTGEPLGTQESMRRVIPLRQYQATTVLGGEGSRAYSIISDLTLAEGDFEWGTAEKIAELESPTRLAMIVEDSVVYAGLGLGDSPWQVAAIGFKDGEHRWRIPTKGAVTAITSADGSVYFVEPGSQRLVVVDAGSGQVETKVSLPCRPWGVSVQDEDAFVTCPLEGKLLRINSGTVKEERDVPKDALDVFSVGGEEIVHVSAESRLVNINTGGEVLLTLAEPPMALKGSALAIVGVDRISVLTPNGMVRLKSRANIESLVFAQDGGSIHYSQGTDWLQIIIR